MNVTLKHAVVHSLLVALFASDALAEEVVTARRSHCAALLAATDPTDGSVNVDAAANEALHGGDVDLRRAAKLARRVRREQPGNSEVVAAAWLLSLARVTSEGPWTDGVGAGEALETISEVAEAGGFDSSTAVSNAALRVPLWQLNSNLNERVRRRVAYLHRLLADASSPVALTLRGRVGVVLARTSPDPCEAASRLTAVLLEATNVGGPEVLNNLGGGVTSLANDSLSQCSDDDVRYIRSKNYTIHTICRSSAK